MLKHKLRRSTHKSHIKTLILKVLMIIMLFASVTIYTVYCNISGIGFYIIPRARQVLFPDILVLLAIQVEVIAYFLIIKKVKTRIPQFETLKRVQVVKRNEI